MLLYFTEKKKKYFLEKNNNNNNNNKNTQNLKWSMRERSSNLYNKYALINHKSVRKA